MSDYWSAHSHSYFSRGDALPWPQDMALKAAELDQPAIALTDHGTMNGLIYLYMSVHEWSTAKLRGKVHPVMGCEFYVIDDCENKDTRDQRSHLTVLAKGWEGYKTMVKMCRFANAHHHYMPILDKKFLGELSEAHLLDHVVITSSCPSGDVIKAMTHVGDDAAYRNLEWYASICPNYFVEVMNHGIPAGTYGGTHELSDDDICRKLHEMAKGIEKPIVVTNDSHFIEKEHAWHHHAFRACMAGRGMDQYGAYSGEGYWLKSQDEMQTTFAHMPEVWDAGLDGLGQVLEQVKDFVSPTFFTKETGTKWHVPNPWPDQDADQKLRELLELGMQNRPLRGGTEEEYRARIEEELEVIAGADFSAYFLMISEYVSWAKHLSPCVRCGEDEIAHQDDAKDHPYFGILVGPGRGSAPGSLVAYLTDITDVDPLRYDLVFERFLDPIKVKYDVPDIDSDFADDGRDAVIQHCIDLYGQENVSKVANWGRLREASGLRKACTALGVDYGRAMQLSKYLDTFQEWDEEDPVRLQQLFDNSKRHAMPAHLRETLDDHPELEELALTFYGKLEKVGTHAAGILITTPGLMVEMDHQARSGDTWVSGFSYSEHKYVGFVKNDILGLRNLRTIQECRMQIWDRHGIDIWPTLHADLCKFDDGDVFKMLSRGETQGVFQFEGMAFPGMCKRLGVNSLSDMVDINALVRPGSGGFIEEYSSNKASGDIGEFPHPGLRDAVAPSYGVILFDEQVLKFCKEVAGLEMYELVQMKKAIKYYSPSLMSTLEGPFKTGMMDNGGLTQEQADEWWHKVEKFAGYAFNRAHAVSYSMIGYWTAWLKVHYPIEYFASLLATSGEVGKYVAEMRRVGIELLGPDVNESQSNFVAVGPKSIRYGLEHVKGMGWKGAHAIIDARPFRTLTDFRHWWEHDCSHRKVNTAHVTSLERIGALDSIGFLKRVSDEDRGWAEHELLGTFVTYDPLDQYRPYLEKYVDDPENLSKLESYESCTVYVGGLVERVHEHTAKNGVMAFVTIKYSDTREFELTMFSNSYLPVKEHVQWGKFIIAKGEWQPDRGSVLAYKVRTAAELDERERVLTERPSEAGVA